MERTQSFEKLSEVSYYPLPNGLTDLYIRKNIEQVEQEDGSMMWEADEVYVRVAMTAEEIMGNLEEIYADPESFEATLEAEAKPEETAEADTDLEERVTVLEEAVMEMAGLYSAAVGEAKGLVVS